RYRTLLNLDAVPTRRSSDLEREEGLRLLEMITGLRMNHNFIRVGGTAADLPDGWQEALAKYLDSIPGRLEEYDMLMTDQPIWRRSEEHTSELQSRFDLVCRP